MDVNAAYVHAFGVMVHSVKCADFGVRTSFLGYMGAPLICSSTSRLPFHVICAQHRQRQFEQVFHISTNLAGEGGTNGVAFVDDATGELGKGIVEEGGPSGDGAVNAGRCNVDAL